MNNKIIYIVAICIVIVAAIALLKLKSDEKNLASNATGATSINLTTDPSQPRPGQATLMFDIKDKNGKAVDTAKVSVDINMATMNMGTQQGEAISQGNGRYAATARFSMMGPWRIVTTVTMPDGSTENKSFTVNVQ